jgi:integrase
MLLKPSTRASRDLNVRRILPHIGSVLLTKLAPAHIRKVDDELAAAGLSGSSRRQAYGVLKAALHQAVLDRLIVASPFTYVPWSPPVEEKEMGFLSALDQARLYALNDEWTALWQFFVATGLRSAECFGLSWRQVDLEGARLTVNQTLWRTPGGWELTSPKTKNSRRTLQLAAEVVEILRTVKSRQAAEAHRLGDSWVNPDEFVFTREAGQPLASYFVSHRLKKSLDAAGVKRCRVHDLRHTFAANHIGGGTPALALSRMLGHASVAFTLQRYGHLHVEVEDAAASLSGRLLEEARRFGETLRPVEVA